MITTHAVVKALLHHCKPKIQMMSHLNGHMPSPINKKLWSAHGSK